MRNYTLLTLLELEDSIGPFELDQIYAALTTVTPREKDVLLVLLSRGGKYRTSVSG